jgi:hypothetical protein
VTGRDPEGNEEQRRRQNEEGGGRQRTEPLGGPARSQVSRAALRPTELLRAHRISRGSRGRTTSTSASMYGHRTNETEVNAARPMKISSSMYICARAGEEAWGERGGECGSVPCQGRRTGARA